ncbi:unnamed protein product [Amoebophrya sp. A25]|nr:unnamed protein product [Amoebophrya sp. A25]|eukprot:GSA25T00005780001.1
MELYRQQVLNLPPNSVSGGPLLTPQQRGAGVIRIVRPLNPQAQGIPASIVGAATPVFAGGSQISRAPSRPTLGEGSFVNYRPILSPSQARLPVGNLTRGHETEDDVQADEPAPPPSSPRRAESIVREEEEKGQMQRRSAGLLRGLPCDEVEEARRSLGLEPCPRNNERRTTRALSDGISDEEGRASYGNHGIIADHHDDEDNRFQESRGNAEHTMSSSSSEHMANVPGPSSTLLVEPASGRTERESIEGEGDPPSQDEQQHEQRHSTGPTLFSPGRPEVELSRSHIVLDLRRDSARQEEESPLRVTASEIRDELIAALRAPQSFLENVPPSSTPPSLHASFNPSTPLDVVSPEHAGSWNTVEAATPLRHRNELRQLSPSRIPQIAGSVFQPGGSASQLGGSASQLGGSASRLGGSATQVGASTSQLRDSRRQLASVAASAWMAQSPAFVVPPPNESISDMVGPSTNPSREVTLDDALATPQLQGQDGPSQLPSSGTNALGLPFPGLPITGEVGRAALRSSSTPQDVPLPSWADIHGEVATLRRWLATFQAENDRSREATERWDALLRTRRAALQQQRDADEQANQDGVPTAVQQPRIGGTPAVEANAAAPSSPRGRRSETTAANRGRDDHREDPSSPEHTRFPNLREEDQQRHHRESVISAATVVELVRDFNSGMDRIYRLLGPIPLFPNRLPPLRIMEVLTAVRYSAVGFDRDRVLLRLKTVLDLLEHALWTTTLTRDSRITFLREMEGQGERLRRLYQAIEDARELSPITEVASSAISTTRNTENGLSSSITSLLGGANAGGPGSGSGRVPSTAVAAPTRPEFPALLHSSAQQQSRTGAPPSAADTSADPHASLAYMVRRREHEIRTSVGNANATSDRFGAVRGTESTAPLLSSRGELPAHVEERPDHRANPFSFRSLFQSAIGEPSTWTRVRTEQLADRRAGNASGGTVLRPPSLAAAAAAVALGGVPNVGMPNRFAGSESLSFNSATGQLQGRDYNEIAASLAAQREAVARLVARNERPLGSTNQEAPNPLVPPETIPSGNMIAATLAGGAQYTTGISEDAFDTILNGLQGALRGNQAAAGPPQQGPAEQNQELHLSRAQMHSILQRHGRRSRDADESAPSQGNQPTRSPLSARRARASATSSGTRSSAQQLAGQFPAAQFYPTTGDAIDRAGRGRRTSLLERARVAAVGAFVIPARNCFAGVGKLLSGSRGIADSLNSALSDATGRGATADTTEDLVDDVPRDFLCPITLQLMEEPVCAGNERHSYELPALREHLRVNGRCSYLTRRGFRLRGKPPIPGTNSEVVYDSRVSEYATEVECLRFCLPPRILDYFRDSRYLASRPEVIRPNFELRRRIQTCKRRNPNLGA